MYIESKEKMVELIEDFKNGNLSDMDKNTLLEGLIIVIEPFIKGTKIAHDWDTQSIIEEGLLSFDIELEEEEAIEILGVIDGETDDSVGINLDIVNHHVGQYIKAKNAQES